MTPTLSASSQKCRETRPARAALLKRPSGRSRLLRNDPSTISSPATPAADPDKPGRPRSDRQPNNHSPPALTSARVQISNTSLARNREITYGRGSLTVRSLTNARDIGEAAVSGHRGWSVPRTRAFAGADRGGWRAGRARRARDRQDRPAPPRGGARGAHRAGRDRRRIGVRAPVLGAADAAAAGDGLRADAARRAATGARGSAGARAARALRPARGPRRGAERADRGFPVRAAAVAGRRCAVARSGLGGSAAVRGAAPRGGACRLAAGGAAGGGASVRSRRRRAAHTDRCRPTRGRRAARPRGRARAPG